MLDKIIEFGLMVLMTKWVHWALGGVLVAFLLLILYKQIKAWWNAKRHRAVLVNFMDRLKAGVDPAPNTLTHTFSSKGDHARNRLKAMHDMKVREYTILKFESISNVLVRYTMAVRSAYGVRRVELMLVCESGVRSADPAGRWGVNPDGWRNVK